MSVEAARTRTLHSKRSFGKYPKMVDSPAYDASVNFPVASHASIPFIRYADRRKITTRSQTTEIPSVQLRFLYLGMQMAFSVQNHPVCPEPDLISSRKTTVSIHPPMTATSSHPQPQAQTLQLESLTTPNITTPSQALRCPP